MEAILFLPGYKMIDFGYSQGGFPQAANDSYYSMLYSQYVHPPHAMAPPTMTMPMPVTANLYNAPTDYAQDYSQEYTQDLNYSHISSVSLSPSTSFTYSPQSEIKSESPVQMQMLSPSTSASRSTSRIEDVESTFVDPFNLNTFGGLTGATNTNMNTRCWFHKCLSNLNLKPGNYFHSVEAAKFAMWLYFTAKNGVLLYQMRAKGLRDLKNARESFYGHPTTRSRHSSAYQEMNDIHTNSRKVSGGCLGANFSYSCKRCNKMLFVAKKKVRGSYNDQTNNEAPYNAWVIRTIVDHPQSECHHSSSSPPSPTTSNIIGNTQQKLNCPHTLDLMRAVKKRVNKSHEELRIVTVWILQDIYYGKVYDDSRQTLNSISNDGHGIFFINEWRNPNDDEITYVKKRQELMTRMVRKRANQLDSE